MRKAASTRTSGPISINIGIEHGAFDMAGPADYKRGLVERGPTRSGHGTPAVIVEAPANGIDAALRDWSRSIRKGPLFIGREAPAERAPAPPRPPYHGCGTGPPDEALAEPG